MNKVQPLYRLFFGGFLIASLFYLPQAVANPSFAETLHSAKSGDARAQYVVGVMYMLGQGTQQNIAEGARWLEPSANAGIPQAMVTLAALYDVGQGVPLDIARAAQLRQQAARAGDPTAKGQIADDRKLRGQADFRRANVLVDLQRSAESIPYAKRAAAAGSANAGLLLGRAYHFGIGVPVDLKEAVNWYRQSSDGGLADGSRHLAYMYEFGLGVGVNRPQALYYYDLASKRGDAMAKKAAANLRSPDYDRPPANYSGGNSGLGSGAVSCPNGYVHYGIGRDCFPVSNTMDPRIIQGQ